MARLLMLAAIVAVVYLLVRSFRRNTPSGQDSQPVEDMVQCAHCGVHLPRGESIQSEGHFFCGIGHRDAYRK